MVLENGHAIAEYHQKWRATYQFNYIDPDWFDMYTYQFLIEAGRELMLHSLVTEVIRGGDEVEEVIYEHPGGRSMVLGKVVIDCTEEGKVCYMTDVQTNILPKDLLEPVTAVFTCDGVDWDRLMEYSMNHLEEFDFNHIYDPYINMNEDEVRDEIRKNVETTEDVSEIMGFVCLHKKAVGVREWYNYSGVGFFIIPKEGGRIQAHFQHSSQVGRVDYTDVRDLTGVEIETGEQNEIAHEFFRKYAPGPEPMYTTRVCPEARVRKTRRVVRDYILTAEDVAKTRKLEDVIGRSSFPIRPKHVLPMDENTTSGALTVVSVARHPKGGGSNGVPCRTLVVKGLGNILVAGEVISVGRPSHNRFLQQTTVTGQAIGCVVAICAGKGVTLRQLEESVSEFQGLLLKQGAILHGAH